MPGRPAWRRTRRLRLQAEPGHLSLDAVAGQLRILAIPGGREVEQAPARREVGQRAPLQGRQGQLRGQLGQRRQVDLARLDRHLLRLGAALRYEGFGQRGGRQHAAVGGGDRKIVEADRVAVGAEARLAAGLARHQGFLRRQPSRDARQPQFRQLGFHARDHAGQGQVGGETGQARLVERDPGAQRTTALGECERIVDDSASRRPGRLRAGRRTARPSSARRRTRARRSASG